MNILGLQIFPGIEAVTDELVLRTPEGWGLAEIAALVERAGGRVGDAAPCTEAALVDQPTRYVQAARTVLAQPASVPRGRGPAVRRRGGPGRRAPPAQDVMDMAVGDVQVQVRRTAPFTATEHARGAAMADLVSDVLERSRGERRVAPRRPPGRRRRHAGVRRRPATRSRRSVDGHRGRPGRGAAEARPRSGVRPVDLRVDPAWQRRGIGTRLLVDAARLANGLGAEEVVLTTRADNQAVLPMVLAAGLRGRIRMAGDTLRCGSRCGS